MGNLDREDLLDAPWQVWLFGALPFALLPFANAAHGHELGAVLFSIGTAGWVLRAVFAFIAGQHQTAGQAVASDGR